jgi:hypothetical protein
LPLKLTWKNQTFLQAKQWNNLKRKRSCNFRESVIKEFKTTAKKSKIPHKFQTSQNNKRNSTVMFLLEIRMLPKDRTITETV